MVKYPIHVTRDGYRGSDPKKRTKASRTNSSASLLERHINQMLLKQTDPVHVYLYHTIASETGVDEEIVRRLCFAIDGGSGGFTAIRHDMTYDEAMEANRKT